MITYRGDRFIKSKKFIFNEKVLTFLKKTNKGYLFEDSGNEITLSEEVARKLKEKINKESK